MTSGGQGSWLARARDENADVQQLYRPLGEFLDLADYLRFDAAAKAAQTWFDHLGRGGTARAATDAEARFKNYVLNHMKLAATELPKLTPAQLATWRKALRELPTRSGRRRGERRSDSTLNRDMTCFRAALNLAYLAGLLTTDFAWRSKLRPIKNADQRREAAWRFNRRFDLKALVPRLLVTAAACPPWPETPLRNVPVYRRC